VEGGGKAWKNLPRAIAPLSGIPGLFPQKPNICGKRGCAPTLNLTLNRLRLRLRVRLRSKISGFISASFHTHQFIFTTETRRHGEEQGTEFLRPPLRQHCRSGGRRKPFFEKDRDKMLDKFMVVLLNLPQSRTVGVLGGERLGLQQSPCPALRNSVPPW